jgi:hypothetical protein
MKQTIRIDYDGNWKTITGEMILDFIRFFLPQLYKDIDLIRTRI